MPMSNPNNQLSAHEARPLPAPVNSGRGSLRAWPWVFPVVWTLLIALALGWNQRHIRHTVRQMAEAVARSSFEKNLLYRQCVAMHGGVYVPVTDKTRPKIGRAHV